MGRGFVNELGWLIQDLSQPLPISMPHRDAALVEIMVDAGYPQAVGLLSEGVIMPIVDQINRDLTEAMKAKEVERLSAIRMVKTALKLRETELPGEVDDTEAIKVLNTLLKQRRDAAEQYRNGGREELALKEENEARLIQTYLPAAASEQDILQAVEASIAELGASSIKDMGAVMKAVRPKLEGKTVDGKTLSDLVKAKLG